MKNKESLFVINNKSDPFIEKKINKKTKRAITLGISFMIVIISACIIIGVFFSKGLNTADKQIKNNLSQYENTDYSFYYHNKESKIIPEELSNMTDYNIIIYDDTKMIIITDK